MEELYSAQEFDDIVNFRPPYHTKEGRKGIDMSLVDEAASIVSLIENGGEIRSNHPDAVRQAYICLGR